jgi:hypothetical protein
MFRVIVWSLVAVGPAGFFWFCFNSGHMTIDQNLMVFGLILDGVLISFIVSGFWMLIRGLRRGTVILANRYGARAFERATQPVRYWIGIVLYVGWIVACAYGVFCHSRGILRLL